MKSKITATILALLLTCSSYGGIRIETQNLIFSNATVKTFGTNTATDALGYGGNGIEIDGTTGVDKNLLFSDGGKKTFTWMIYRGEGGKFFYLHDYEAEKEPLVVSRSGRFAINKVNNILNYHTMGPWAEQSSDLEINSELTAYTKNHQLVYRITVDATGTPDTYKIETAPDCNSLFTQIATGLGMATTNQCIGNGIYIYWTQTTGHAVGQVYIFVATCQLPRATFGVSPMFIDELIISTNLMTSPAVTNWIDRTFEANSSEYGIYRPFRLGTNSCLYIGMLIPNNAFYVDLASNGVGVVAKREYWNGSTWKSVSNVVDGTYNYTQSGEITFDADMMSDWSKNNLTIDTYTNLYYWYRTYSTNAVTVEPYVRSFTRHGKYRLNAYESPLDTIPKMEVDSSGNTWIGGLSLTPSIVQTFYYKFLAQCSTQTTASTTSGITPFTNEVSDVYNVFTNAIWYPNTLNMVRMSWSIRSATAQNAGRGFWVVLFENGTALRDIGRSVSGDNTDIPQSIGTYIFKPSNATNGYSIGLRRFNAYDVICAGGNTNWWFGEKIQ